MLDMILTFLKSNWGNVASVGGLVAGLFSVFFAKRASVAARNARDAVFKGNIADDFSGAKRVSRELSDLTEDSKYDAALSRCTELQELIVHLSTRWAGRLVDSTRTNLAVARSQVEGVRKVLVKFAKDPSSVNAPGAARLVASCNSVKLIFVFEEANAKRIVQGE